MKFLKEDYGQSTELNDFVFQSLYRFSTYYKVTIFNKYDKPQVQERYFAFDDAARDYYNKLLDDLKEYGWEDVNITLSEVKVKTEQEDLEEFSSLDLEDEEEEIIDEE